MILIWGSRVKEKILGYLKEQHCCNHCNNTSRFMVFMRRRWFTLFWISLFPTDTRYYLCCPICHHGGELSKKDVLKMQEENTLSVNETTANTLE